MSTLYLGTDLESLAQRLAVLVEESARTGDLFMHVPIIVPNRYLGRWLQLWLARRLGMAVNFRFLYLEDAAWQMLRDLDPRSGQLHKLDDLTLRFMILAVLLDEGEDAALTPLRDYLKRPGGGLQRDLYRRAWQLADRLAGLLRDYEYHRQDELVRPWLSEESAVATGDLERAQRELFRRILALAGLRDRLSAEQGKVLRTLPQLADEVMASHEERLETPPGPQRVHLFGITQISRLHLRILRWLGERYDFRLYHLNPLCGQLSQPILTRSASEGLTAASGWCGASSSGEAIRELANRYRAADARPKGQPAIAGLLGQWAQAGAESLWGMADLLEGEHPFAVELMSETPRARQTVLGQLQNDLLRHPPEELDARPDTDDSLRIVACPGIYREVETVYHSIVDHLRRRPDLKQTDIAVLVTDMPRYRPVLQAVFDRRPQHVKYNLADFSAGELSAFGHGILGLLDLALESFTRSRVFATLLNPCFLARQGVDREQALVWLEWAEALGIYHGWDVKDKPERGSAAPPLYSWRLGLQRLRLGRLMEVSDDWADVPTVRYQDVVPFADLASSDKEQLNAFCRAVEGLLPVLARLHDWQGSGQQWALQLRSLVQSFLDVPADRPEEEEVRNQLFHELGSLETLDKVHDFEGRPARLPLSFIREFVQNSLERREGTKGQYLTGGVTISALQPLRPVPFEIICVLGLGEGLFPGMNLKPALDLRSEKRCDGDIYLPESNRFLLLETLLAARRNVCLLYNCRDLQNDRDLYPCSPLNQLRRHLERQIVKGPFEEIRVPLCGTDLSYLDRDAVEPRRDVLANYSEFDRVLALADGRREKRVSLDRQQTERLESRLRKYRQDFMPPAAAPIPAAGPMTISINELARFLRCPAEGAIRRHVGLQDQEDSELQDDEPFYTNLLDGLSLMRRFLERFVRRAVRESAEKALGQWRQWFAELYEDCRLRGRTPDGPFAVVDRTRLEESLHDYLVGTAGLARFIKERAGADLCGPIVLGESMTPIGARQAFPALQLAEGLRLVGSHTFAWHSKEALDFLVITTKTKDRIPEKGLSTVMLQPLLFYLALRAGTESGSQGKPSAAWLGKREFRLHLTRANGIVSFSYLAQDFSQHQAATYLASLVRDLLDPSSFDLLPFELVVANTKLQRPFRNEDIENLSGLDLWDRPVVAKTQADYARAFEAAIEADQEKAQPIYRPMNLMRLIDAKVPADAWLKMRRRFQPLDLGPARARQGQAARPSKGSQPCQTLS
jgi:exodeoxyribonuclease V gamma subunit